MSPTRNAARVFNAPRETEVDGQVVKLYELDANELAELERWANVLLLHQFQELWSACGAFTIEHLQYMTRVAADRSMKWFSISSDEVGQILQSLTGLRETFYLSVRHGDPTFTADQARAVFARLSFDEIARIRHLTGLFGHDENEAESAPDPKASAAALSSPIPGETIGSTPGAPAAVSTS